MSLVRQTLTFGLSGFATLQVECPAYVRSKCSVSYPVRYDEDQALI